MPRAPLYALTAAVSLVAAMVLALSGEPVPASAEVVPAPPLPDETALTTGVVLAGAADASVLTDVEMALTEEAAVRSTTTTTTMATTTTSAPPASKETSTPETTAPPATSPPPTTPPAPTDPGGADTTAESGFADRINALRSANGLGALSRDGPLDARARDWSLKMSGAGSLSHSNIGSLIPPWGAVAENVGVGGSVSAIFDLLVNSSGHLANMLGDYTHFGIGVWVDADGVVWTTQVFTR